MTTLVVEKGGGDFEEEEEGVELCSCEEGSGV